MTSLVCICGDHSGPWVLSFSRLRHLPSQIPAFGEISVTAHFPESILSDSKCPEGTFDPKCKASRQNQNQDFCGGTKSQHTFQRRDRDSLWKNSFLFFLLQPGCWCFQVPSSLGKTDFVSKLEPNTALHEVSSFFVLFCWHSYTLAFEWSYWTVWVTRSTLSRCK